MDERFSGGLEYKDFGRTFIGVEKNQVYLRVLICVQCTNKCTTFIYKTNLFYAVRKDCFQTTLWVVGSGKTVQLNCTVWACKFWPHSHLTVI